MGATSSTRRWGVELGTPAESSNAIPESPTRMVNDGAFFTPLSGRAYEMLTDSSALVGMPPVLVSPEVTELFDNILLDTTRRVTVGINDTEFPIVPVPYVS